MKYLISYMATLIVMVTVDALWLGVIAKPVYQQGIGHLMAERPQWVAAALFYAVFALGLMLFAVLPHRGAPSWSTSALMAAMFGFFCYATYDLTNLATLKGWPLGLSLLDIAWGSLLSAIAATAGRECFLRWGSTA
jgi:uncharacterized membrane protein